MKTLLYATTNNYKLLAANNALANHDLHLEKLDAGVSDVAEIQSSDQEEVALDKAVRYFQLLRRPLVVMDFGFFLEGLKGFPGVYTKYAIDTLGVEGMIGLARMLKDRRAYAKRTIVYKDDSTVKIFSYSCPGTILLEERGVNGRDFDRLFQVNETGQTLAEMSETEKAKIVGRAWRELGDWLRSDS